MSVVGIDFGNDTCYISVARQVFACFPMDLQQYDELYDRVALRQ